MESAGAEIVEVRLRDVREHLLRLYLSAAVEAAIPHAATYPSEAESYSPGHRSILELGYSTSAVEYATTAIWRREFRGELAKIFKTVDMIVAPAMSVEPPTLAMFNAVANAPLEAVVALKPACFQPARRMNRSPATLRIVQRCEFPGGIEVAYGTAGICCVAQCMPPPP